MRKMIAVVHYECKMQFKRLATWGVLFAVTVFSLLDTYPSAGNLARLEFLKEPAYFVYRTMSMNGFVLMFGLMFLLAERFPLDKKTGMIEIRLFYLLAAILSGINAAYVGSANAAPFYLITSGDLIRLIWAHPGWTFIDMGSIFANGIFLIGSSLVCRFFRFL